MNNLWLFCGLTDAKIRASDKDLPVSQQIPKVLSKPMVAVKSQKLVLAFNQKALLNWIPKFP